MEIPGIGKFLRVLPDWMFPVRELIGIWVFLGGDEEFEHSPFGFIFVSLLAHGLEIVLFFCLFQTLEKFSRGCLFPIKDGKSKSSFFLGDDVSFGNSSFGGDLQILEKFNFGVEIIFFAVIPLCGGNWISSSTLIILSRWISVWFE